MCIIFAIEPNAIRPNLDELTAAESSNGHGAGMAWLSGGNVMFARNLSAAEVSAMLPLIPDDSPVVVHFRLASQGEVTPALTHPFPLDSGADLNALSGTSGAVLVHNGTIDRDDWLPLLTAPDAIATLPGGPWSDTKALAFTIARTGNVNVLDLFSDYNRFAVLSASDRKIRLFGDWIDLRDGVKTSCRLYKPAPASKPIKVTTGALSFAVAAKRAAVDNDAEFYDMPIAQLDYLDDDDYFSLLDLATEIYGSNPSDDQLVALADYHFPRGTY